MARHDSPVEGTLNRFGILKISTSNIDVASSFNWTLSWVNVEEHWRLVVIEDVFILCVFYSIE
jgi:hypothetical protein